MTKPRTRRSVLPILEGLSFRTSAEAKKFGGVFQDSRGRLREANGQYAKTNEVVEQLGRTFQRTGGRATDLDRGFMKASSGAGILTRSVSSLGGVLGALSIAAVTHEVGRAGDFQRPGCG